MAGVGPCTRACTCASLQRPVLGRRGIAPRVARWRAALMSKSLGQHVSPPPSILLLTVCRCLFRVTGTRPAPRSTGKAPRIELRWREFEPHSDSESGWQAGPSECPSDDPLVSWHRRGRRGLGT